MSTNRSDPNQAADPGSSSHLFTLRVWYEQTDPDGHELRLQVRHILTGETRYFRAWPSLIAYLTGKLDAPDENQL